MNRVGMAALVVALGMAGVGVARAEEGHDGHDHAGMSHDMNMADEHPEGEQTLTGEVIDVMCNLDHGASGKGHADCAKKCIKSGLPVALKVGDQLYLAAMADHTPANATLAEFAGEQVTVHGTVKERDGQRLIEISKIEKAE